MGRLKLSVQEEKIIKLLRLVSKSAYNDDEYMKFYDLEILRLKYIYLNNKQFQNLNFKLSLKEVFPDE
jgi:hypothetical protein